jgi:hypothetical protein
MKKLYLNYNNLSNNFSFGEGKSYETRRVSRTFDEQEIIEKLNQIDSGRNTEFYLKEVPNKIEKIIIEMFKGTKISVKNLK